MSDNQKKILAKRIKTDLQKEIESGNLTESPGYLLLGDTTVFAWKKDFFDAGKTLFEPSEFEKEDYQEIVSLIRRRIQLYDQELAKEEQKRKEKLDSDPRLFYHSACRKDKAGAWEEKNMRLYHHFRGRKNGQDYTVEVAINHPALNNVFFNDKFDNPKTGFFYLIDGVENLPSEKIGRSLLPVKWVELENNITITLAIDNGNVSQTSTKDIRKIFEEEWENKNNKDAKELNFKILLRLFQEWNIKSIEPLSSEGLLIKYNDGRSETIGEDYHKNGIIKNSLRSINFTEKSLNQQKLEKLQVGSRSHQTTSPKPSFTPYLIGAVAVMFLLGAAWIGYRIGQKKNK